MFQYLEVAVVQILIDKREKLFHNPLARHETFKYFTDLKIKYYCLFRATNTIFIDGSMQVVGERINPYRQRNP